MRTETQAIPNTRKPRDDEIDVHGLTHVGRVRKENQDHFLLATVHKRVNVIATNLAAEAHLPAREQRVAFLAMVADGVGGAQGGAEASATALESVMQYVNDSMSCLYDRDVAESKFTDMLQRCALRSHEAIRERASASEEHGSMATTLTLFMGVWPAYYLVQLGDSRYYLWRDGRLTQVTRDQTLANDLVDQGILSRAHGADTAEPVVTRLRAEWDSVHLLCSDGLTKHVSDQRIADRLAHMTSAKQVCEQLLADALEDGGSDNITIIVGRNVPKEVE
jgi:serine/threonine protein phosphatase PrpC